jgi:hypothetical protein
MAVSMAPPAPPAITSPACPSAVTLRRAVRQHFNECNLIMLRGQTTVRWDCGAGFVREVEGNPTRRGSWESARRSSPSRAPEERKQKGERLLLSPIVTGSALRKPTGRNCRLRHEGTYTNHTCARRRRHCRGCRAASRSRTVTISLADAAARYAQDRGIVNTNRACHFPWLSSALPQLDQGSCPGRGASMVVPPC